MNPADFALTTPAVVTTTGSVAILVLFRVLPLRGGNGQHAGAGPGALTVWQLRAAASRHEVAHGNAPFDAARRDTPVGHIGFSRAERALREILDPVPDDGYVGRHRLSEPVEVEQYLPPWPLCAAGPVTGAQFRRA